MAAWKSFLVEADEVAQVHLNVSKRLLSDICTKVCNIFIVYKFF